MSENVDAETEEVSAEGAAGDGDIVPVGVKLGSTRTVIALPTDGGEGLRIVGR